MADLKIGQVAGTVGVGVDTIRYYERLGLLPKAPRRASNYRVFDETTVERIKLIKQLQDLGLSLQEIDAMLRAVGEHASGCEYESEHIKAALARTDEKLAALTSVRNKLQIALSRCTTGQCNIVDRVATVVRLSKGSSASTAVSPRRGLAARRAR